MADLLVASTGGHLAQLYRLVARMPQITEEQTWITFDTPQSRSLLHDRDVGYLPYTGSRAYLQTLLNTNIANRILRSRRYERVISTGAAPALSFLPLAVLHRMDSIYIESAARSEGPSLTGRILSKTPGVRVYTQYEGWADRRWGYAGSVFDSFQAGEPCDDATIKRVVVTLGTIGGFSFSRLLQRLVEIVPATASVLWQVGSTDAGHLAIDTVSSLPSDILDEAMRKADVVVAHAGIGSALAALEAGRCPVLVPREREYGEHVDDHQRLIAQALDARGLAIHRTVEQLTLADLASAARRVVSARDNPPPICLGTGPLEPIGIARD